MPRPIVLIHGYSADGLDFKPLCDKLTAEDISAVDVNIGNYVSLNNEITIKDIAEGFDRALRNNPRLGRAAGVRCDRPLHRNAGDPFLADELRSGRG